MKKYDCVYYNYIEQDDCILHIEAETTAEAYIIAQAVQQKLTGHRDPDIILKEMPDDRYWNINDINGTFTEDEINEIYDFAKQNEILEEIDFHE